VAGLFVVLLPAQAAWAHGPSDGGAARGDINGLFTIIFFISIPVFLLVEGLILFAIFRYRRRRANDMPEQSEGNRQLELTWTIVSFLIVAVVFVLTYRFMTTEYEAQADEESGEPVLTVHVTGYMFDWDYEYFLGEDESTGVKTTRKLTVPADSPIYLEITSSDVQHSFWVPELAGKLDAIPGHTNSMWLTIDEPGLYKGNCAEFCGTSHHEMVIELEAINAQTFFDEWLPAQIKAASEFQPMGEDMESALPAGDAGRGEQLFNGDQLGCYHCHGEQAGAGPSLSQIREDAEDREGYTAEQHLRESILMPCAYEADGYSCNIMSADYDEKLDAQMLADLIEYLMHEGE
jgi:cytochrome c oxidase subunit 2